MSIKTPWPSSTISEIGKISGGLTKNRKRESLEIKLPYLRVANVYQNELRLDEVLEIGLTDKEVEKTRLQKGDLLVVEGNGSKNQIGRLAIWDGSINPCVHQNHLIRVRLGEQVLPKFATYWLSSREGRREIEQVASSTSGLYTLSVSKVGRLPIPLPPLPEQRRIVARIEELFSRLDAGVTALRHAKAQLQRYRQSVLAAAVTGQLTHAWREQHPDTEPAEELLERILEQRQEKWNGRGKYKDPDSPDVSKMPKIPGAWRWARLDAVCAIGSGMSVSKNRKHKKPIEVPYLRVANVQRGHLVLDEVKLMEIEADRLPVLSLKKGDVLFNEGGDRDKLGRGWIWQGQIEPCITQNHVFRASAYDLDAILPRFISHWGNVFGQQFFLDEGTQTTNLASINKGVLSSFPVPIPTIDEQHQIVAEVEARTTAIDHLEAELEARTTAIDHLEAELDRQINRSNRLRQSTLASAFSGQLS